MHAVERAETIFDPEQAHGVKCDLEDRQRDRNRSDRSTDEQKGKEESEGDIYGRLKRPVVLAMCDRP